MASSLLPTKSDTLSAPTETIERILHLSPKVHIYAIPPLSSNKGHQATLWTSPPSKEIFTARLRILESSTPTAAPPPPKPSLTDPPTSSLNQPHSSIPATPKPFASSSSSTPLSQPQSHSQSQPNNLTVTILLEDPASGELFAAAPYTSPTVVEAAVDSTRFFAVRVQGEGGRRAVLGLGFEERTEALDFGIALQAARKVLGLDLPPPSYTLVGAAPVGANAKAAAQGRSRGRGMGKVPLEEVTVEPVKRDWSLKEGEMLRVDIGGRKSNVLREGGEGGEGGDEAGGMGGRAVDGAKKGIEPPSGGGQLSATGAGFGLLPPPPSAREVRADRRRSKEVDLGFDEERRKLEVLGFDDGEFGEFQ